MGAWRRIELPAEGKQQADTQARQGGGQGIVSRERTGPVRATLGDWRDWDTASDASEDFETDDAFEVNRHGQVAVATGATSTSDAPSLRRGPSLKSRAVSLLSRREYSRHALAARLATHAPDPEALAVLLDELQQAGWLSDERYARSILNQRAARQGERRIIGELRRQRVDETLLQSLSEDLRSTEYARAWEVWRKRFEGKSLPDEPREYARQARFLAARGFAGDVVGKVLRAALRDEPGPEAELLWLE